MSFIVCLNHCKSNWKSKQKLNTKSICEMSIMLCTVTFSALQRDSCQRASVSVRITWLYRFRSLTRHELCLSELVTFMSVLPGKWHTTQHNTACFVVIIINSSTLRASAIKPANYEYDWHSCRGSSSQFASSVALIVVKGGRTKFTEVSSLVTVQWSTMKHRPQHRLSWSTGHRVNWPQTLIARLITTTLRFNRVY